MKRILKDNKTCRLTIVKGPYIIRGGVIHVNLSKE